VDAGSRLVSGARGGESDPIRFADARTVWWQASYSGDGNNFAAASTCIAQTIAKTRPTISVALTSNRLFVRARVAATLNGGSTNAGGNVTYAQYYDSRCSGGAFSTTALGTVRVTNGVVPQSPTTMLVSTSNYVVVTFTGDDNNEAANSGCVSLPAAR
jgi:hypothetical protein